MRTSSTLRRIARNRVVRASLFFASNECPVCAPFSRSLVFVNAIRVGKMFSRAPCPDMAEVDEKVYGRCWNTQRNRKGRHGLDRLDIISIK